MAKNLKRFLDSRGLNPHQFSEIMGFKYTTVMNWMKANSYPRIDKIELMAHFFGVDKSDLVEEYSETSSILSEINQVTSKLTEPRQKIVLETANNLLKQQEKEKITNSNIISLKSKASELTDEEFEKALNDAIKQTVAFDGKPLDEREQAIAKQMLREAWEEDNGKR